MAFAFGTENNITIHNKSNFEDTMTYSSELSSNTSSSGDLDDYNGYLFDHIERMLSLGGVSLNLVTIIILLSLNGSLKTQLKLILSLALSDFVIALCHFVLTFYSFPNTWKIMKHRTDTKVISKIAFCFLYTTAQYAGLGTMCAISVDIFIKVRKPFKYKTLMSKRRGNIIITCLWLVPSLVLLLVAILTIFSKELRQKYVAFSFFIVGAFFGVFTLLFFFIFLVIYTVILCSVKSFMRRQPSGYRNSITKTAVTIVLIIATYFVCILPSVWITILLGINFGAYKSISDIIMSTFCCLYILNTVLDPIIYAIRIPEINARYRTLLRRMCRCTRPDSDHLNMNLE